MTGPRGRVSLWDSRTLAPAGAFAGVTGESQALAYSPDGGRLAVGEVGVGQLAPLKVWDVRRRAPASFRGESAADSMAFSPDGSVIAAAAGSTGHEHPRRGDRPARQAARYRRRRALGRVLS